MYQLMDEDDEGLILEKDSWIYGKFVFFLNDPILLIWVFMISYSLITQSNHSKGSKYVSIFRAIYNNIFINYAIPFTKSTLASMFYFCLYQMSIINHNFFPSMISVKKEENCESHQKPIIFHFLLCL
jgi:hypothetical protein